MYLHNYNYILCNHFTIVYHIINAAIKKDLIFTPTPHPIPFISRQIIIFHDSFPFSQIFIGFIKKILLKISLFTSNCKIGYINQTVALIFLKNLRIPQKRLIFSPNKIPVDSIIKMNAKGYDSRPLIVGLFGTDSIKKNYDYLFETVINNRLWEEFSFLIYGHETPYYSSLICKYTNLRITLCESDQVEIYNFLSRINVVVSVSRYEGFGRPISVALLNAIPCYLIDTPVFKEFFHPGANFFDTETKLLYYLNNRVGISNNQNTYIPSEKIIKAYQLTVNYLKNKREEPFE